MPPSSQQSSSSRSRKSIREKEKGGEIRREEEKGWGKGEGDARCCGRGVVVVVSLKFWLCRRKMGTPPEPNPTREE